MKENSLIRMASDIYEMLDELELINDFCIREYCGENDLDYDDPNDYSRAASRACEYVRPLSCYELSLLDNIAGNMLTNSETAGDPSCVFCGSGYNEYESSVYGQSIYGLWKRLERAVKKGRKSLGRRARNLVRKTRVGGDEEGRVTVGVEVPFGRLGKEYDKGKDRLGKELTLGAVRTLSFNLRRISEDYDRCGKEARRTSDRPDERYRAKMRRCDDVATAKVRWQFRPILNMTKDPAYREWIKEITKRRNFKDMRKKLKWFRDDVLKSINPGYARFFDWL